jgi:hypothetical protein
MKRSKLFVGLAGGVVGLWATASLADVFVEGYVEKEKEMNVTVDVTVTKFVTLYTQDYIPVDASSEQTIVKNQRNQFNFVQDEDATATAQILDTSTATATGIILINQSPGFINNQGNEVSVTFATTPGNTGYRPVPSPTITNTDGTTTPLLIGETPQVASWATATAGVFAHAEVSVEQVNGEPAVNNDTDTADSEDAPPGDPPPPNTPSGFSNQYVNVDPSTLTDTIGNSGGSGGPFAGGSGVAGVNQAAGSLNNQNNALAISLGDHVVHALGELDLGQFNTWNQAENFAQVRTDTIAGGAFNGFSGVAMVNQSSGSINNQANVVDIAVGTDVTFPVLAPH